MSARRVGYAPGAFDLFHIGHLNILRHARENCDYLIAGVASDAYATSAKGRLPIVPFAERFEIVKSIRYVDKAVVDHSRDKRLVHQEYPFEILFKGDDWRGTDDGIALEARMAGIGVEVHYFSYTVQTSSTHLREALERLLS